MFRGCVGLNTARSGINLKDTFTCVDTFPLLREEVGGRKQSKTAEGLLFFPGCSLVTFDLLVGPIPREGCVYLV
jgi:hypothetical protein